MKKKPEGSIESPYVPKPRGDDKEREEFYHRKFLAIAEMFDRIGKEIQNLHRNMGRIEIWLIWFLVSGIILDIVLIINLIKQL